MNLKHIFTLLVAVATLGLAACGGGDTQPQTTTTPEATEPAPAQDGGTAAATGGTAAEVTTTPDGVATVRILPVGNEMRYEQTEFTVEAGQTVRIVFENTATSPAMHHNVVVLNDHDNATANRVGQAALTAAGNDYIPEDDAILAHTPMSAPGETVEVEFTAPEEPGDYLYICTYPGHYAVMQGTMRVVASAGA